jgi:hypothetical protein
MSIEQRLEQVERQTKRLRIAVVVLAAALCGVVSMAAKGDDIGNFKEIYAKEIYATKIVVKDPKSPTDIHMVVHRFGGGITIDNANESSVNLSANSHENGGSIFLTNKTGDQVITIGADDYGNGEVGAWNRKGKGRVWDSQ